jgi:hypothetical protein
VADVNLLIYLLDALHMLMIGGGQTHMACP